MKRCLGICLVFALAVLLLAAASPASAQPITPEACITCHTFVTPGIVTQFNEGAMSANGVTCVSCHGDDHDVITQNNGHVPASTCAGCHPQQYAEFTAKDAQNTIVEKHALGWTRMTAAARYAVMPAAERSTMCERCHNIGYVWPDQSIGKCDSCHTRHVFSAAEAQGARGLRYLPHGSRPRADRHVGEVEARRRLHDREGARRRRPEPCAELRHLPHAGARERCRPAAGAQRLDQHHVRHRRAGRRAHGKPASRAHAHHHPGRLRRAAAEDAQHLRTVPRRRRLRRRSSSPTPTR